MKERNRDGDGERDKTERDRETKKTCIRDLRWMGRVDCIHWKREIEREWDIDKKNRVTERKKPRIRDIRKRDTRKRISEWDIFKERDR